MNMGKLLLGRWETLVVPFVLLLVLLMPVQAMAFNYDSIPLGTRSASMGGASTALGSDNAALYRNPANISLLNNDTLSLGVNVYGWSNVTVDDFFTLADGQEEELGVQKMARKGMKSSTFDVFPSSLAYFYHFSPGGMHMVVGGSFLSTRHIKYNFSGDPQILLNDGGYRASNRFLYEQDTQAFGPHLRRGV